MNRRAATFVAVALVTLGTLLFLIDRYVLTPRSVQRSLFGEPITSLGEIPTFDYQRGFGPWVETWTYALGDPLPAQLRAEYGCRIGTSGVTCSRCQSKLLGMCFLGEMSLPSGEYRLARIIDGKFRVERGVGDDDPSEHLPGLMACLPGREHLVAFQQEMQSIAQAENMKISDWSERKKREFAAIDPDGRSHDPRQPVFEIALTRSDGMGLIAGNLALPPNRMAITFSKGSSSGSEAEQFAKRVAARIARRWTVIPEGPGGEGTATKECPRAGT